MHSNKHRDSNQKICVDLIWKAIVNNEIQNINLAKYACT